MTSTTDYFQCLICSSFFSSLWKVEKHVKTHADDETPVGNGISQMGRRRGMLPIRKTTFFDCYVPVVKNQIDPEFLAKYENVEANDESTHRKSTRNLELKRLGVSDDVTEEDILNGSCKRPRRGNLQAKANIRKVTAILTVPDHDDDEDDSDKDFIEGLLQESVREDDSDFDSDSCKKGKKRRESKESAKAKRGGGQAVKKKRHNHYLWIWDGKEYPFKCEYCPYSFPKRIMLSFHIVREHKDVAKTIKCPVSVCSKTCVNFSMMSDHIGYHSRAERRELFVETELERLYNDMKPDKETLKSYGLINCQFCLWSGDYSLEKLKKHKEKEHGNIVVLQCPCCEKTFQNSVTDLVHHVKSFHPSILDPFDERQKKKTDSNKDVESKFKCDKCGMFFKYEGVLKQHLLVHENEKKYDEADRIFKCPSCCKTFRYKDNLRRHFTLHLENNPWTCDFPDCNRKFNSSYNLRRHKLLHSESYVEARRVSCPICNQIISAKDRLARHMRTVHTPEEVVNGIPVPSKLASKRRRIRIPHISVRKNQAYYAKVGETEQTDPATNNNGQAPPHNSTHDESSIIKSEQGEEIHLVDRIILEENGTAIHIKGERLSPQKITSLPSSSKSVPQHTSYSLTQRITHDPAFKKLDPTSSEVQGIITTRNYNYHSHTTTFTCKECQSVFSRAWTLQLHLKAIHNKTLIDESSAIISQNHNGETSQAGDSSNSRKITLMCGTCAYVAEDSEDLNRHMNSSHNDIRKYRCDTCGVTFKKLQRLQRHIKEVHTDPRNHLCKYCKKGFTTNSRVRSHEIKVHENPPKNEERKQCTVCLKMLSPRSYDAHLKRHEKKTAKEMEKLKCQLCKDVFSCNMALKRHIDCIHLGKPLNKLRHERQMQKKYPWWKTRAAISKRKKDEWFRPLLQKMNGTETVRHDVEAIPPPEEETEEGEMAILGI